MERKRRAVTLREGSGMAHLESKFPAGRLWKRPRPAMQRA
jgi:hypothetical protein